LAVGVSIFPVPAVAEESPRSALEFFSGTWTLKGHETTYSEVCAWLPGGGFLACRAEDRSESPAAHALSVFGYSEDDAAYTYHGFSGNGSQRMLRGSLDGGVWRFHGQTGRPPAWRRWQVTITPTSDGFAFLEEVSDESAPWKVAVRLEFVRKPEGGT
jgi:hypothetical protein